ncbi:recombinase family protein [Mesorhizobium sp. AR07]|uniref:recombinase family protein n=1 Tax=Mesorhizobium sp. AR07 TaxID=2865838 RepID=UPI00215F18BB|nr:recombinase family protein [Mesorhizobium sp. AR07]
MFDHRIALYARVSTKQQARDHTIASQLAALHERIAADEQALPPDDAYVDEGYSGSVLVRHGISALPAFGPSRCEMGTIHKVNLT